MARPRPAELWRHGDEERRRLRRLAACMAGSMGVLGVIAEVSIKVLPFPHRARRPCALTWASSRRAQASSTRWGGQPLPIHASAWWDGALVLRLAGARKAAVQDRPAMQPGRRYHPEAIWPQPFWAGLRDQNDEFFMPAPPGPWQGGAKLVAPVRCRQTAPAAEPARRTAGRMGRRPALGRHADAGGAGPRGGSCQAGAAMPPCSASQRQERRGSFAPLSPALAGPHPSSS